MSSGARESILLVDDDDLCALALALTLKKAEYTVTVANDFDSAKREFNEAEGNFDIVVTDLLMPGGTGLELLKHVEASDADLPVIIVTADRGVEAAAEAVRKDAFDYLTKPVPRDDLLKTVARAVERRRSVIGERHAQRRLAEEHRQLGIRHQRTAMLLSVLYNRAVEGILVLDDEGRLVDASESFVTLVGEPLYELLDVDIRTLFGPHPSEGDIQDRIVALAKGPIANGHWRGEVTVRDEKGRHLPAKMSLSVCETPAADGEARTRYVIALLYYETAYEQLSRQLQQADRLATIGLLAGSAAHEIKNELGPLLGYLTMIENGNTDPVGSGMIGVMRESARRVNEHVEQILEPLRPRVRTRGAVVLADSIEAILVLLRRAGRLRRIRFAFEPERDGDVVVHADKDEVHQIALNLLTNAIDALGDGGGGERGSIEVRTWYEGDLGVLEVRDDGRGIDEELRARVFEPFFTTKGSGGTGLGLPVVNDIVRSLKGRVTLDCNGDRGTVVTVRVPRYKADV